MYNFLLLLSLYLPFQVALNPAAGVDLASIRVLIILLFLLWLAQGLKNKKVSLKNKLPTWLIVTFLFLNAFSLIASRNTDWSLRKLAFLFSIFPLYFIVADVIDTRKKVEKMVKFLVGSGATVALIGIGQFISQFIIGPDRAYLFWANYVISPFLGNSFSQAVLQNPSWLVNIAGRTYLRATATFPDPHMLSFYLGMLVPLALGVVLWGKNKNIFWVVALAFLIVGDLLTFSRGGYLGLFAGAVILIIFFWNKLDKKYRLGGLFFAGILAVALLIPSPVTQRFYSSFNLAEGSNAGRIAIWQQALKIIADNPLVGVGIGNYPLAIKATADYREPIYAHNAYLDIAAETGIADALVWASLLLAVFLELQAQGRREPLFLMASVSIAIFAVHSLVETPIYSPTVLALLLIIFGFSNIKLQDEKAV